MYINFFIAHFGPGILYRDFFIPLNPLPMLRNRTIDHIVFAVPDLEQAMQDFEERTGVAPVFGGYHAHQGTKNAIVNMGQGAYLEMITVDHANKAISAPRWMGVDLIQTPKITRWSLKSDRLSLDSKALQKYDPRMGHIQAGQRRTERGALLSWMMSMPLAHPAVEIAPFVTSWGEDSIHPTTNLPPSCALVDIHFGHPDPSTLATLWAALQLTTSITKDNKARISLVLDTPKGRVEL